MLAFLPAAVRALHGRGRTSAAERGSRVPLPCASAHPRAAASKRPGESDPYAWRRCRRRAPRRSGSDGGAPRNRRKTCSTEGTPRTRCRSSNGQASRGLPRTYQKFEDMRDYREVLKRVPVNCEVQETTTHMSTNLRKLSQIPLLSVRSMHARHSQ